MRNMNMCHDLVLLFRNAYTVERLENDADLDLGLQPWALPPATAP